MPKSLFLFLGFLALSSTGLSAQQQQDGQATRRPFATVQGHPHESVSGLYASKPYPKPGPKPKLGEIDPRRVDCWSGHLNPAIPAQYVDSAYLIVKWTDGKREEEGDSMLVWGYVWNSVSLYKDPTTGEVDTFPVTVHSIDMLRAIANADCRLLVLLQQTGVNGYTVGGIGYNFETGNQRVPIRFDLAGAKKDSTVTFRYDTSFDCTTAQNALPFLPDSQAVWAIRAATPNILAYATGIIEHPFNINYGYPAYDYQHWVLTKPDYVNYEWQSGWNPNYWAFFTDSARQIPSGYPPAYPSSDGVTTRVLQNNYVDGFVFAIDPPAWPPVVDFSGDLTYATCPCNPCPPKPTRKPIKP
jgi:hypothetical protein